MPSDIVKSIVSVLKTYIVVLTLPFSSHRVVEEVGVCESDSFTQGGGGSPAEARGLRDIEELAGGTVGLGGVPLDAPFVAHGRGDEFGECLDGKFLACACVDCLVAGIVVHQEHAQLGEVVDIKKFSQRTSVTPADHDGVAGELRFMEAADERGKDVGVCRMVVVVGTIEVGGHHGDVVRTVLAVEELAVFQAGDLGEGVGLVGLLKLRREQARLGHRLRCHAGVDARRAEELEFLAAVAPCGVDDVHLKHHVVVHEVCKSRLICLNPTHLRCGKEDVFGFLGCKEAVDCLLVY